MLRPGQALRLLALVLLLGSCSTDPCDVPLSPDPGLTAFHERLSELERGTGEGVVRILHLGDSHIAGDNFSSALQVLVSERFGDAGRGQMPPGLPFKYYRRHGFSFDMSEGWTVFSALRGKGVGPFGLSGTRAESASASDWMSFDVVGRGALMHLRLELLEQPSGGTLIVEVNGAPAGRFSTAGPVPQLMEVSLEGAAIRQVRVRPAGDGPVALLGWGGEGDGPGISYEAHGLPGATVGVLDALDEEMLRAQLSRRPPDLVLLGFGTNEGFDDALNPVLYRQHFGQRLALLKAMAPQASFVVLGAFDGARLPSWAVPETPGAAAPRSAFPCDPLALHERATYGALSAGRDPLLSRWHEPPNLSAVRDVQREVAASQGVAYWDGAAAMGGACGIHTFVFSDPPLAYGDHVHLTPAGAEKLARDLWTYLMGGPNAGACRVRR